MSPANPRPVVSVVILSWNRRAELALSLNELRRSTYPSLEIIVVDNDSADDSVTVVRRDYPEVRLIVLPKNIGVAGFNAGFEGALGEYIVVLDDDSYPVPDAIDILVGLMGQYPRAAAISGKIIDPRTGRICTSGPPIPEKFTSFWGGGAMLRRSAVVAAGGYDQKLFVYANEYDLCVRLIRAGHDVFYCRDAVFYHLFAETARPSSGGYLWGRNEVWFNLRYVRWWLLPVTLPRSTLWILTLARGSLRGMWTRLRGVLNGFVSFDWYDRDPVDADVMRLLMRHHWSFKAPTRYLWNRFVLRRPQGER